MATYSQPALTTNLQNTIEGWSQALLADSLNPLPNYSINGQSVSREQWRKAMLDAIGEANQLINQLNPYIITTKYVL